MEWKPFVESSKEYPEEVVKKSIAGFSKAAQDLAELRIQESSSYESISSDLETKFQFRLVLTSPFVKNYRFTIFELGYDVELFPVRAILEISLAAEIFKKTVSSAYVIKIATEEDLTQLLSSIFETNRFKEVVAGLMKIAKRSATEF